MPGEPLPPIRRALIVELLRQLGIAREQIEESIQHATSADVVRRLQRQRAEVERVMGVFRAAADHAAQDAAGVAWQAGMQSIQRLNPRALLAIRMMLTDRIKDVSESAIRQINTALTQHLLGVRTLAQTISDIQGILDGATRRRAMTIANTEIGRAYNAATYEALLEQAKRIPGLKKRWIHSQKEHGRGGHIAAGLADPILVEDPFEITDPKTGEVELLRFPLDPNASARNTINCGCMMEAVLPAPEDIFAGPIGPIVQPGEGTPVPAPVPDPAPAAPPAPTPPPPPAPAPRPRQPADDIFAGPIGPIVQPGTIVRNGVVVQVPAPATQVVANADGLLAAMDREAAIRAFVERAADRIGARQPLLVMGDAPPRFANAVRDLGIANRTRRLALDYDNLRHLMRSHGQPGEVLRGQVPIATEDLMLLPQLLDAATDVAHGNPPRARDGAPLVAVTSAYGGNTYVVVMKIRRGEMVPYTMYKRRR